MTKRVKIDNDNPNDERRFIIRRTCLERGLIMDEGTVDLCTNPKCTCDIIRQNMIKQIEDFIHIRKYEALILSFIPKLNNYEIKEAYYKHFKITNKRQGQANVP